MDGGRLRLNPRHQETNPLRIGLGASLGALALLHAQRGHPESFDALFLQSGSFFRRAESYERTFPRYERIARFVGGVHRSRPERTIPVVLTCGTVEENLAPNRALEASLRSRGYDARLFEIVRVSYLLANKKCVVSETGSDTAFEKQFESGVAFAPYAALAETCMQLLQNPAEREAVAGTGFNRFKAMPQTEYLKRALATLP